MGTPGMSQDSSCTRPGYDSLGVSVSGTSLATALPRPDTAPSRVPTWSATTIRASRTPSAIPTS